MPNHFIAHEDTPEHLQYALDHFAAAALTGILQNCEGPIGPKDAARAAFNYAEAMMRERHMRNCVGVSPEAPNV